MPERHIRERHMRERQDCNERHVRGTLCLETWNVEGAVQFNPEREAIVQYKRARCSCERGDGDEPKA